MVTELATGEDVYYYSAVLSSELVLWVAFACSWAVSINSLTELSLHRAGCELSWSSLLQPSLFIAPCSWAVSINSLTELSLRTVASEVSMYSLAELSMLVAACSWAMSVYSLSNAAFSCLSSPPFSRATLP